MILFSEKKAAGVGLLYGVGLVVLAALTAGFGHGLHLPLGLIVSPFSVLGVGTGFFVAPLFWTVVAFVAHRESRYRRNYSVWLLMAHYSEAALVLLVPGERFADYADFARWGQMPQSIKVLCVITLVAYALGQIFFGNRS